MDVKGKMSSCRIGAQQVSTDRHRGKKGSTFRKVSSFRIGAEEEFKNQFGCKKVVKHVILFFNLLLSLFFFLHEILAAMIFKWYKHG